MRETFLGDFFQHQSRVMLICHMEIHIPRCLSPAPGVSTFQSIPPYSAGGKKTFLNRATATIPQNASLSFLLGHLEHFSSPEGEEGTGDSQPAQIPGRGNVPLGERGYKEEI